MSIYPTSGVDSLRINLGKIFHKRLETNKKTSPELPVFRKNNTNEYKTTQPYRDTTPPTKPELDKNGNELPKFRD